ncbi:MAG TPA: glycosyltransferase family 4 protein [Steroidobacteraceae bacterium]|nr:glycosyltransferase family 4 protein [Steroidobacteraceae bacterium]
MPPDPKPRVAYVRGSFLNPFEAQYLEPLADRFDITAVYPRSHRFDVSTLALPSVQLPCLDYVNGLVPRRLGGISVPNPQKRFGFDEFLFGLDRFLPGIDLVHAAEQTFYCTYQIAKRKRRYGYRLICLQAEINPFWAEGAGHTLERTAFVRSVTDLFIARSQRAKSALLCEGVEPERIRVIGHGIDTTRFAPGPRSQELCRRFGIEDDQLVVLLVGRLVWEKGLFSLADAASLLLQEESFRKLKPVFVLAGSGPERGDLERRLRRLGIEANFRLIGAQPYSLLPEIHRLADIFVLPSISTRSVQEQFGIAIIEAMASGKPILATRCGAIDEVVGPAGVLVQANDYYRLAEGLKSLAENPDLRRDYGQRALDRVRQLFTREVIGNEIAAAYNSVLEKR